MRKLGFLSTLFAASFAFVGTALAQVGGPGLTPSPWIVNGSSIYYNKGGVVVGAPGLPGGNKGVGTINVSGGFYVNNVAVSAGSVVNSGTINQLAWYAASGTTLSGLATANSGVLITSAGGVPSISSTLPASLTIPTPVINGTVSGTGVSTINSASTLALRDANGNLASNNFIFSTTNVVSAAGTSVLTSASSRYQRITGSTTQTFQLPNATTLTSGWTFEFDNNSTGALSIVNNGSVVQTSVPPGGYLRITAVDVSTANGIWDPHWFAPANVSWGTSGLSFIGTSANALTVGPNGTTNPSFNVDASTASSATGVNIKSAAVAGGVAISAISSGTNESLTINAKGSGLVSIGGVSTGGVQLASAGGGVAINGATIGSNALAVTGSSAFGITTATSLALNGATIGTNALAINGTEAIGSTSAASFSVGPNGATNPVFQIDSSTASQAAGVKVTGAVTGGTVTIGAIDSGANTNLAINPKGTGSVTIGGQAGVINITAAGGVAATTVNFGIPGSSAASLVIAGQSSGSVTLIGQSAASGTLTLPNGADTLVARTSTDTMSNKTLASPTVTTAFNATGLVTFADMASAALASTAQWRANTANLIMQTDQVWASGASVTLTDAATVTPDFSTGFNFNWTLGATGRTLASPTNVKVGQTGLIQIIEDATGSRTITTYGSTWKFSSGVKPVLTSTANAIDLFAYFCYATTACVISSVLNAQ